MEFESGVELRIQPYFAAFLKMLECFDGDNVGETKQLKQKQ